MLKDSDNIGLSKIEEKILTRIANSRNELIKVWKQNGLQHHETIEVSQKLDELIIKYQKQKILKE